VADFGLAKRLPREGGDRDATVAQTLTEAGAVLGTAPYMSPEQTRGDTLDAGTDIFSLGVVLYEAATGRLPFEGPTVLSVMHEIAMVEPPAPSRVRPGLPRELDAVILRAMAKERSRRFASAGALGEALRAISGAEEHAARATMATATVTTSATATAPAATAPTHAAPLPAPPPARTGNLPVALTSFVGRLAELEEVSRLVRGSRLLTLTGAGGCGKSRLAVQVASNLVESFPDGAWMVELAPLEEPALVIPRVAASLGVREEPGRPLLETLRRALASRALLLVLDNCEHLLRACAEVASALLAAGPGLRILATSREPIGIAGETTWRVPPLSVPDLDGPAPLSRREIGRVESVRLFLERAAAAAPAFALTDETAETVARICARLDGIPLAIELAAARARVLPVGQILARLEDRFRLLKSATPGELPHHETLRATVDWSYDLLSLDERTLFDRLSVFAGGASLEAVETVCADESIHSENVLDLLTHLADKSLLYPEEGAGGSARYRLLETLREYGRERLKAADALARFEERHAGHFAALAARAEPELSGPRQPIWLSRLSEEHDNLRRALQRAVDGGDGARALRMARALWRFWWTLGYWDEGRRRLEAVLAMPAASARVPDRAHTLRGMGVFARRQGEPRLAETLLRESLAISRETGDLAGVAAATLALGSLANDLGRPSEARALYEESLPLYRDIGDHSGEAAALHNLANVAEGEGDFGTAGSLYDSALSLHRRLGNAAAEATTLNGLGSVAKGRGEWEAARAHHDAALRLQRRLGDRRGIAYSLGELGSISGELGERERARELLVENLKIVCDMGDRVWIADSLERFAAFAARCGEHDRALRLEGAAAALREEIGAPLAPAEGADLARRLEPARMGLGAARAGAAHREGRALGWKEAAGYARGD
jgi:non-specific serine/threonine protein kinase